MQKYTKPFLLILALLIILTFNLQRNSIFQKKDYIFGTIVDIKIYGESKELCGGTHVNSTSEIGLIKILSESSVASGIRRIEASTGLTTIDFLNAKSSLVDQASSLLKSNNIVSAINKLKEENKKLVNENNRFQIESLTILVHTLNNESEKLNDFSFTAKKIDIDPKLMKELSRI